MRFGLLTQWFDPEPGPAALPGVLARGLAARGHEVRVLTGFPNYPTGRIAPGYHQSRRRFEHVDGLDVTRVALYPSHDDSFGRRLANYASFGASATLSGAPALRGLDALWVNYSPVTVAPAMWLGRFAFGVPSVVHVADLWPDTLTAGGFALSLRAQGRAGRAAGATAEAALHLWCRAMYASSDYVTYISPGVRPLLLERGVPDRKLRYAPMWADERVFGPADDATDDAGRAWRHDLGIGTDDIVLLYAGALGQAQGLQTLLEACAEVDDPRLRCVIAGSGVAEGELRRLADDLAHRTGRAPAHFIGRVPQEQMPVLMAGADACYVGLRVDRLSAATMPSKTQATLAAGKALVVAADGDIRDVVRDSGAGLSVGSGDVAGLAEILRGICHGGRGELRAMGGRGRRYYDTTFSVAAALDRAESVLTAAATSGRSGRHDQPRHDEEG